MGDPWKEIRDRNHPPKRLLDALLRDADALLKLVRWIDANRHADWPYASFNLEEWEDQKLLLNARLKE